jgi:hypothetical protein
MAINESIGRPASRDDTGSSALYRQQSVVSRLNAQADEAVRS